MICVIGLIAYAVSAWDRLAAPSPHFHFVDLAASFLDGRLDTDTPRRDPRQKGALPEGARPGYEKALTRHALHADGSFRGWNDWASVRTLTLKSGEVLTGVFPWRDQGGEKAKEFHALNGQLYRIDCGRDVRSGCHGNKAGEHTWFVSFPPWPSVLLMPVVAALGYNTNDVWFTLLFAAANGALLYLLLDLLSRTGRSPRSRRDNLWLTALFLFGTVHWFSAIRGEVWFTGLIVGVTMNLLALLGTVTMRRPWLGGLLLGLGFATRTPLLFGCVLPLVLELPVWRDRSAIARSLGRLVQYAVPLAAVLAVLMVYNAKRFGSPFEFGHTFIQEGMRPAIRDHGLFSGWFLPQNLSAAFTNPPVITFESWPFLRITRHGLGLLWTTPLLFLIFGSTNKTPLFWGLVAATAAVAVPGFFYQNTGWEQFGYRFGLDWLPMLIAAFAVGGRPLTRGALALLLFGVLMNAVGAASFGRYPPLYY